MIDLTVQCDTLLHDRKFTKKLTTNFTNIYEERWKNQLHYEHFSKQNQW